MNTIDKRYKFCNATTELRNTIKFARYFQND